MRSIYLDAVLLGVLQKQGLTRLEDRMAGALDSSASTTMAELEQEVSSFRHRLWAQHLTPHGIPNRLLIAYQRQRALPERYEQVLTEISDFNRLARDDESRHVNGAAVVFSRYGPCRHSPGAPPGSGNQESLVVRGRGCGLRGTHGRPSEHAVRPGRVQGAS
ncbi:hypothetical protein ABZ897_26515 [Nonomuraea sp. NPDC046802]|uniref:hypothetical protein n=1 Tax=Nonomuraea sp. NPDC046802 TaxID=3154919 RepID=UPI00340CF95F